MVVPLKTDATTSMIYSEVPCGLV